MTQAFLLLHMRSTLKAFVGRPTRGDWEYILIQDGHLV